MANCSNCSAPLQEGSMRCAYCGSQNDIDLKAVHYYTNHETESERICPRCNIKLKTIDLNVNGCFLIERCDQCFGLFFDPNELESLLEATVTNVFTINRSQLNDMRNTIKTATQSSFYIKCPVCGNIMNRVNFGTNSGVIVDRCKSHGLWLDGGELRNLFEWMKAGGKLLQQEKDEERRINATRELEREKRKLEAQSAYTDDSAFGLFGGTLQNSDPDLFDIVKKALGSFILK